MPPNTEISNVIARGVIPSSELQNFCDMLIESELRRHSNLKVTTVDKLSMIILLVNGYAEFLIRSSLKDGMLSNWGKAFSLEVSPVKH